MQALGQHVDGHVVERDGDEHLALVGREVAGDRLPDGGQQLGHLGVAVRRGARIGERRPARGIEGHLAVVPRAPAHLHARLEQGELVGPGGEAALAAVGVELGQHRHERVVGALVGDVVELLAADVARGARSAADLEARGAQEQLVQSPDALGMDARVAGAQHREPLARVGVGGRRDGGAGADGQRDAIAQAPGAMRRRRVGAVAAMVGCGVHRLLGGAPAPALTP